MPHGGVDPLHITPLFRLPVFKKKYLCSDIWRHVLGVLDNTRLAAGAVTKRFNNNFLRGIAITDGTAIETALYASVCRWFIFL